MGLDIFFYKLKDVKGYPADTTAYEGLGKKREQNKRREYIEGHLKSLKGLKGDEYKEKYMEFIDGLSKLTIWDYKMDWLRENIQPYSNFKKWLNDWVKFTYKEHDAYFRKVNFLYRYFANLGLDGSECRVTNLSEIKELIRRCDEVLESHDKAHELLPTVSGFFFGPTDYSDAYFEDVSDVRDKMTALIDDFDEENDAIWVYFSW